jgi:type VII secretion-associated serine protease mycosin
VLLATALTWGPAFVAPWEGRPAAAAAAADCIPAPPALDPSVPWAQHRLRPERAWSLSTGANILVGVVDTGVDSASPQLAGRVERGIDLLNNGGSADSDCLGHGTFVAGIIAAAAAKGTGFTGIAPDARILPIRVTNEEVGDPATFAAGIRRAVDAGAKVINVSASTTTPVAALADAVAYAESHDVVLIASAPRSNTPSPSAFPAALDTVIAVGAIDATGVPANFSQAAPYLDLTAPGVDVTSIGPRGPGQWLGTGTSYAAPFVAGTAALVRAYRPGLTAAQVRNRLKVTADHAPNVPDPAVGWGVVNPLAALATVLPEESGSGATNRANPDKPMPLTSARADGGGTIVLLGAGATVLVGCIAALLAVLGPAGHRRRWRPTRVVRVTDQAGGHARNP